MNTDKITKKQLMDKYKDEKVFIVPQSVVSNIPDKFTKMNHKNDIWGKYDNLGKFIYRYDAEQNPEFQQIIPYLIISNNDESKYFVGKRLCGDHRLADKLSLGFGGHIDECDGTTEVVLKGLTREIEEELDIDPNTRALYIGTIRDITSSTNDHFGLAFAVKATEGEVFIRETEKLSGIWMTKQEMFDSYHCFEGWSKFILDYLFSESN